MSTSARISGAVFRDDTIQRLGGQGDNWCSSWAADGSLLIALCDGAGFPGLRHTTFNSRLYRAHGHPDSGVTFSDVLGYPELSTPLGEPLVGEARLGRPPRYYGFGTLAVDGSIYQYLSTFNLKPDDELRPPGSYRFTGAKLIYSPDAGDTWHNQDGSTPVRWEDWDERSRGTLAFWDEPGETFSLLSILQMGRDYDANTDGYVYVYAPDGNDEGTMNRLVMLRVPKSRILDRGACEYFVGGSADRPVWSRDLAERGPVHVFPEGWVNRGGHPYAWQPSVTYNPGLGVYLMANWATGPGEDGEWFARESYLGLYESPTPWGPWRQFHEDTAWAPGGDAAARCYQPQIPANWISADGTSFWLVWTDFQTLRDEHEALDLIRRRSREGAPDEELVDLYLSIRPYYSFNVQRVDLVTR